MSTTPGNNDQGDKIPRLRPTNSGNFENPWGISDAVLQPNDSDVLFHVNRTVLATFSPYFQSLFFSDFKEKDQDKFKLDISHNCLREILRTLHHTDRNFKSTGNTIYPPDLLRELYIAGDKHDIYVIRELVRQQLAETAAIDALHAAVDLNLETEKIISLRRMTKNDVASFLYDCDENSVVSLKDVREMMMRCGVANYSSSQCRQNDRSTISVNFNETWGNSNVILRATDCEDYPFHVNSSVLATFSPFFHALFFGDISSKLQDVVDLDIDVDTLLNILRVIHHVNRRYGARNPKNFTASQLSQMYKAADKWDMDVIKQMCKQQLLEAIPLEAFQEAIDLKLSQERIEIFEKLSIDEMESFLVNNKESGVEVFTPKEMAEFAWKLKQAMNGRLRCPICNNWNSYGRLQEKTSEFAFVCGLNNSHKFNH